MKWLLGAGLAVLLTACGGGYEPDMAAIEDEIAADLSKQVDVKATVDCPDTMEWRVGDEFYCQATIAKEPAGRVSVAMQNDAGEYYWQLG